MEDKKTLFNVGFMDFSDATKKCLDYKLNKAMEEAGVTQQLNRFKEQQNAYSYVVKN